MRPAPFVLALIVLTSVASSALIRGSQTQTSDDLETIPARWIDLPEAPFVARMLKDKAVLVNRADRAFDTVYTGCVIPHQGRADVVGQLFIQSVSDGEYGPGDAVNGLLRMLNNLPFYIRNGDAKPCPEGAYFAVTGAASRDGHGWKADGTPWPVNRDR
jgi:hypothetical protein